MEGSALALEGLDFVLVFTGSPEGPAFELALARGPEGPEGPVLKLPIAGGPGSIPFELGFFAAEGREGTALELGFTEGGRVGSGCELGLVGGGREGPAFKPGFTGGGRLGPCAGSSLLFPFPLSPTLPFLPNGALFLELAGGGVGSRSESSSESFPGAVISQ